MVALVKKTEKTEKILARKVRSKQSVFGKQTKIFNIKALMVYDSVFLFSPSTKNNVVLELRQLKNGLTSEKKHDAYRGRVCERKIAAT